MLSRILSPWKTLTPLLRSKYEELLGGKFFTRDYRSLSQFSIGEYTYGFPRVLFPEPGCRLVIGRFCSIARGVEVFLGGEHCTRWISTYPFHDVISGIEQSTDTVRSKGSVTIGSDVWVGREAMILSGVEIGHGAVVGARSVVTKSIPPYAIYAGNPAQLVRFRFAPDQIEALLEIQWWNWDICRVRGALPLLQSPDADGFIRKYRQAERSAGLLDETAGTDACAS